MIQSAFSGVIKRVLDIAGASFGLVITGLVFLPIALVIKFTSHGPVIFRQTRVGKGGRLFKFYKFRTMVVDATFQQWQLDHLNEATGPIFKIKDDPRTTSVGRFLRKYSLDELPQFWNVFKGDMSLVGPRPPLVHEVTRYSDKQWKRLSVQQGMTGLWQISGRSKLTFETMVDLDLYYIEHRSLRLDIKILWHTLPIVTRGIGSY
jgi:lipopolysaccharide/colanic/teichoic acid biosynthesis glycosyltransferase